MRRRKAGTQVLSATGQAFTPVPPAGVCAVSTGTRGGGSAADVDFPIDVVLCERDSFTLVQQRCEKQDLAEISNWWQERLRQSVNELRADWADPLLSRLPSRRGR